MATFVSMLHFTEQGVKAIGDSPKRAAAFKAAAKKLGARVLSEYWTLGPFDGLIVFEAADESVATAVMLQLSVLGNVRTQTVRAFDSSEFGQIVERLQGERSKGSERPKNS